MSAIGYRHWRLGRRGLWSPLYDARGAWTERRATAQCGRRHDAPAQTCGCGLYVRHALDAALDYAGRDSLARGDSVIGAARVWGRAFAYPDGIRAEHLEIVALGAGPSPRLPLVASELGVPVVPLDRPEAFAEEFGSSLA